MIICRDCGSEHSDSAAACPKCGARRKRSNVWLYISVAGIVAFLIFGATRQPSSPMLDAVYEEKNSAGESAEMRRLIDHSKVDQCWDDASKATLTSQATRQAECKALEAEFTRKYNIPF